MVSITNSVIFLFKLELKQFNISKILPMWKIGVYIVLIMNIFFYNNEYIVKEDVIITLLVIFFLTEPLYKRMMLIYTSKV
jgi:uncharacterized membrane protein